MNTIIEQLPVKHARRTSKAIAKGSPNYTQMLKQRGYTDEFLVELVDAVELIEPGLLNFLKHFYNFRQKNKRTPLIKTEDFNAYTEGISRFRKENVNEYPRMYFVESFYTYKPLSIFNTQRLQNDNTRVRIMDYKDDIDLLNKELELNKGHKKDIREYREELEEDKDHYYFGRSFIDSLKRLYDTMEPYYDQTIEAYEAAIRDYHARRAAEKEALKEKQATKRLIKRLRSQRGTN